MVSSVLLMCILIRGKKWVEFGATSSIFCFILNFMGKNAQKDYFLLYASQLRNVCFFPGCGRLGARCDKVAKPCVAQALA